MAGKVKKGSKKSAVRVRVESISFTRLDNLPPAAPGTVRVVNYGSCNGRVGRPRKRATLVGMSS